MPWPLDPRAVSSRHQRQTSRPSHHAIHNRGDALLRGRQSGPDHHRITTTSRTLSWAIVGRSSRCRPRKLSSLPRRGCGARWCRLQLVVERWVGALQEVKRDCPQTRQETQEEATVGAATYQDPGVGVLPVDRLTVEPALKSGSHPPALWWAGQLGWWVALAIRAAFRDGSSPGGVVLRAKATLAG